MVAMQNTKPGSETEHLETSRLNIRRVLLPTDYSESSDRARQWAMELAGWFESKLYLLNAVAPVLYTGETGVDGMIAQEATVEAAKEQLATMAIDPKMRGREHEEIVTTGPVAAAIRQVVSA
ncbi:MAG: universal stress protein, partial [Candidatus Korobacteraceae bacterium]